MTRIDYLVSRYERLLGVAPPAFSPMLRAPLLTLVAALGLIGILTAIEHARMARVERDVDAVTQRLTQDETALQRFAAQEREVSRLRMLDAEIERVAQAGTRSAAAVATIGNAIPGDAWLSSIHRQRDGYALEGDARRVAIVGHTLASLAAMRPAGRARLLSIQTAPARRGVTYAITVDGDR
jgi:Tfp pilus assembly protein PilN